MGGGGKVGEMPGEDIGEIYGEILRRHVGGVEVMQGR